MEKSYPSLRYPSSHRYAVLVKAGGGMEVVRESTGTGSLAKAEEQLAKRMNDIR